MIFRLESNLRREEIVQRSCGFLLSLGPDRELCLSEEAQPYQQDQSKGRHLERGGGGGAHA